MSEQHEALRLDGLVRTFGGLTATNNVSLRVKVGERRAIIGPNGAGKTTLFNLISGELPVSAGTIWLHGRDVTGLPAHARANLGMGRTFQRNNLFLGLSVFENVRLAVQHQARVASRWRTPTDGLRAVNEASLAMLELVGLAEKAGQRAGALAYGQQRALEIALALACEPRLLLLDEPTAGMSPAETVEMVGLVASLPPALTLLIIEHDMDVIFSLADSISVLHYGQLLAEGTPAAIREDPRVKEVYLGQHDGAMVL